MTNPTCPPVVLQSRCLSPVCEVFLFVSPDLWCVICGSWPCEDFRIQLVRVRKALLYSVFQESSLLPVLDSSENKLAKNPNHEGKPLTSEKTYDDVGSVAVEIQQ